MDENMTAYYLHLQNQNFDFIIGHAPYLANGSFNMKDIYKEREVLPKIILIVHCLPKDEDGNIDDELLLDWLTEADIVFSIGKAVENEIASYYLNPNQQDNHEQQNMKCQNKLSLILAHAGIYVFDSFQIRIVIG